MLLNLWIVDCLFIGTFGVPIVRGVAFDLIVTLKFAIVLIVARVLVVMLEANIVIVFAHNRVVILGVANILIIAFVLNITLEVATAVMVVTAGLVEVFVYIDVMVGAYFESLVLVINSELFY